MYRGEEDLKIIKKEMIQIQNYIILFSMYLKILIQILKNLLFIFQKNFKKLQLFIEFLQQNILMKNILKTISKFHHFFEIYHTIQSQNYLILTSTISFSLGIMLNCNFNKIQNFKAY